MKKLFLSTLLLALPLLASAYDISVDNADGVTIYYNYINDGTELEVVNYSYSKYSGTINIPDQVVYNDKTLLVTSIGNEAFRDCNQLIFVTIGNNVVNIGDDAFYNCTSMTYVSIPNSVVSIGGGAFWNCSKLYSIEIPNSVTYIGAGAFKNSSIPSIIIPSNVTTIESETFAGCNGLTSITVPQGVTRIGKQAFFNCPNLTSVTIPNSVTSIGKEAFAYCQNLTSITIPNSLTAIEDKTFYGCNGLNSVTIGNSVTSIGTNAFCYCNSLSSVNIPNSVTTIGSGAFLGCTALASVVIGNGVSIISEGAFRDCSSLTSVTIPNSVTAIYQGAFYGTNLSTVCSLIENPFEIRGNEEWAGRKPTFNFNATLYIPVGTLLKYLATPGWNDFKSIKEGNPFEHTLTYLVDGETYSTYTLKEGDPIIPVEVPSKEGYTFSGWSEIPETMPANDLTITGTFVPNKYKLTYMVDGEVFKTSEIEFGSPITSEAIPTKEGYTFSGWSEIPETMPANDVTVTGTFTPNKYKLTYTVDGVEYKTAEVDCGAAITPEDNPTKEGYTFSGWSEIPETMPASDVTITGTFTINTYTITYMVDNTLLTTEEVTYGSTITPPASPKEGYEITWNSHPTTMPAYDITIYGSYISTGINGIYAEESDKKVYTPDGKRIQSPKKGMNIIRMNDGTTKKVVVK